MRIRSARFHPRCRCRLLAPKKLKSCAPGRASEQFGRRRQHRKIKGHKRLGGWPSMPLVISQFKPKAYTLPSSEPT